MQEASAKKTILIVDDVADNIQLIRKILASCYRIKIATSGEKALALADCAEPPDLILLDVMMPGIDGYEVCRRLKDRQSTRNIPVIFVTAKEDAADEEKGFAAGAVDYITKPVTPSIVEARVATHLALRQAVADLERQNEILTENVKLREQVERIMRHDLKTPLTAFIGIPALLKRRKDLPSDVMESVRMLEKSGAKMLDMINKSMDLYKMEMGTYKIHPVPVELVKIVEQIKFELSDFLDAKSIRFRLCINNEEAQSGSEFFVNGEESLFYAMLANFIKNALEACPENEVVSVAFFDKPHAHITVSNPGIIPVEVRDKFLHKFISHGKRGGTGLGGYSARLMAETAGGSVSYTSDEISGTTILISFADLLHDSSEGSVGDLRALVIDDNEMLVFAIRDILRSMGLHQIETVADSQQARAFLHAGKAFQLIIIDWNISADDCKEFVINLAADVEYKQVPLLVISSEPVDDMIKKAVREGSVEFIAKPFSPDLLVKKVEGLMDHMLQLYKKGRINGF
ncbi:MAG: response regulator [Candidatus Riflebacteria bacterium]|nr:response regulator [Candidatus Riflebacteria bacterium]